MRSDEVYEIVTKPMRLWALLRNVSMDTALAMNAPTRRPPRWEPAVDEDRRRDAADGLETAGH